MAGPPSHPGRARDVLVAHTSDLHLGSDIGRHGGADGLDLLRQVLAAAEQVQLLLVAGDLFDNNRLPLPILAGAAQLLTAAGLQVVVLPGNHDALTPDSVYYRGPVADASNVCVLGVSAGESIVFPEWSLEVWGRAHRDYADMSPFHEPVPRTTQWRIVMAHGHFDDAPAGSDWWPSWRIHRQDLAAAEADYVALGHWNRAACVGDGLAQAYYSGSPDLAGTINLVRLTADGCVQVTREPLRPAS